jgi:YD repeat-containing protein
MAHARVARRGLGRGMLPVGARALITLAAAIAARGASAQVLADGGFDTQAAGVAQYCYDVSCPNGSWTLTAGAGFARQGNVDWPAPTPVSAADVLFLQGGAAHAQQHFSVPTSGKYIVVYWLASRSSFGSVGGSQIVTVGVSGQMVAQVSLTSGQSFNRYLSVAVDLIGGSFYTLDLTGSATSDQTAFVDNVSVVPASSTTNYQYDALGRLTSVAHTGGVSSGATSSYTLDPAGNRTHVNVSGGN